jgi:hypothetical protein
MCPHCQTTAPIVYRGMMAYCTACGAPRVPLASASVTLAGKPAKLGGTVTRVLGWIVLVFGLCFGAMLGLLLTAIFSNALVGIAVGLPVVVASVIFGALLLHSGSVFATSGTGKEREARKKAIFALAEHQDGIVRARDAAESIGVSETEADAILTDFAKTMSDIVSLELDDSGGVYFRIANAARVPPYANRVRVDANAPESHVDDEHEKDNRGKSSRRR